MFNARKKRMDSLRTLFFESVVFATASANVVTFYMFTPICNGSEETCSWPAGGSMDIGAQIMVKQINDGKFLKGNHSLRLVVKDTQCDATIGLKHAANLMLLADLDRPFGAIGGGCSAVTPTLARFFNTVRMPLVSHSATATDLSDRTKFPNFYRMFPPDGPQIEVWFSICHKLKWTKIALVYDISLYDAFVDYVESKLVSYGDMEDVLAGKSLLMRDISAPVAQSIADEIVLSRVRVIVTVMYAPFLRSLACQMARYEMRGTYIFHLGWYAEGWQYADIVSHPCSREDMKKIFDYSISVNAPAYHNNKAARSTCAMPNFTIQRFADEYQRQREILGEEFRGESSHAADAICMMAILFNEMLGYVSKFEELFAMDEETFKVFNAKAQAINFLGISGPVSFPSDASAYGAADRISAFQLFQMIGGKLETLGTYDDGRIIFDWGKSLQFDRNYTMTNPPPALFPVCPLGEVFVYKTGRCQGCPHKRVFVQQTKSCECTAGHYESKSVCVMCETGSYGAIYGATACTACIEGFFTQRHGSSECQRCPNGKYSTSKASAACAQCPTDQTTKFQGATSHHDCKCEVGTYHLISTNGSSCASCGFLLTTHDVGASSSDECAMSAAGKQAIWGMAAGIVSLLVLLCVFISCNRRMQRRKRLRIKELEGKQFRSYKDIILKADASMNSVDYPMVLIRCDMFLELGELITHEVLRDQGYLTFLDTMKQITDFKEANYIVFFSHQWLGWGSPDPDRVQYQTMSAAIQNVIDNAEVCGENGQAAPIKRWYVWCDFISIPQKSRKMQLMAVTALPLYACVAHVFVIVAPTCRHCDSDVLCNIDTYMFRGWCRAEMLAKLCGSGLQRMFVAKNINGAIHPVTTDFSDMLDFRVFQGDFSCCDLLHQDCEGGTCDKKCDKENLVVAILGLYLLLLRQKENPRVVEVLKRIEMDKLEYFPATFEYRGVDGHAEQRELFGPLLTMMEEHAAKTDWTLRPSWSQLLCNMRREPSNIRITRSSTTWTPARLLISTSMSFAQSLMTSSDSSRSHGSNSTRSHDHENASDRTWDNAPGGGRYIVRL